MKRISGAFVILCLLALVSCKAGTKRYGTYATFNAGLAYGYVLYAEERQPLIGTGVAGVEADVVCMQEVWLPEDMDDLLSAASSTFPYSYWENTYDPEANTGPAACIESETADLLACVNANCLDAPSLSDCVLANCPTEFGTLASANPDCVNCLVANLSHTVEEIFDTCHSESKEFLYEAANGVAILSRWELRDTAHLVMDSTFNKRLVLFARTENDAGESVALFCTHLTPEFDGVPYTGDLGSWQEEQAHQIGQIMTFIDEQAQEGEMIVFMADTNNGPELPSIDADLPENYALITDAGFVDPYAEAESPLCTYCAENPLNVDMTRNAYIDHVFFKNPPSSATYEPFRIIDGVLTLETDDGTLDVRHSDHYGSAVTVTK
jgi:endonuclease/exonuclease/phosphatase family metal-dependent hydrolase